MSEERFIVDQRTQRLALCRPSRSDLDELFVIESDPRVWVHYPTLRHADPSQTLAAIDQWIEGWRTHGLDTWTIRLHDSETVIGYGGCSARGEVWNLGYRLAPAAHGHGYATNLPWRRFVKRWRSTPDDRSSPGSLNTTPPHNESP